MTPPLAVGLVGAGPWATMVHAPVLAAGPETRLAAVWARQPDAATQLTDRHGGTACASIEQLFDRCDAVAFAVPPEIQADLALRAVAAGKAVLLEKPIAHTLAAAETLAAAVDAAGVASVVVLTARFSAGVRHFLDRARTFDAAAGLLENVSGALLDGPFAHSPWRHESGVLLDVGPHALDLLTAALGPVEDLQARAHRSWVRISLRHTGGALSDAALSAHVPGAAARQLRLFGPAGVLDADLSPPGPDVFATLRSEFAQAVRTGVPHPCDVHRGLELQRLIARAQQQL